MCVVVCVVVWRCVCEVACVCEVSVKWYVWSVWSVRALCGLSVVLYACLFHVCDTIHTLQHSHPYLTALTSIPYSTHIHTL